MRTKYVIHFLEIFPLLLKSFDFHIDVHIWSFIFFDRDFEKLKANFKKMMPVPRDSKTVFSNLYVGRTRVTFFDCSLESIGEVMKNRFECNCKRLSKPGFKKQPIAKRIFR